MRQVEGDLRIVRPARPGLAQQLDRAGKIILLGGDNAEKAQGIGLAGRERQDLAAKSGGFVTSALLQRAQRTVEQLSLLDRISGGQEVRGWYQPPLPLPPGAGAMPITL